MPRQKRSLKQPLKTARASVSFPPNVYDDLLKLAAEKKVSVAWVVREAAEQYVAGHVAHPDDSKQEPR